MKSFLLLLGGLLLLNKRKGKSKGVGSAKQLTIDFDAPYYKLYQNNVFQKEFRKNLPQLLDIDDGTLLGGAYDTTQQSRAEQGWSEIDRHLKSIKDRQEIEQQKAVKKAVKQFQEDILFYADEPAARYANEHYTNFTPAYEGFLDGVEQAMNYYINSNGNFLNTDARYYDLFQMNGISWFNNFIKWDY